MERVYKETRYKNTVVSNDGNMYNTYGGTPYTKKNTKVDKDITKVRVKYNGHKRLVSLAREVALAFVPNPDNFKYVKHKDGDRSNNSPCNLYWSKTSYMDYSKKIGMKYNTKKKHKVEGFKVLEYKSSILTIKCITCNNIEDIKYNNKKSKKCRICEDVSLTKSQLENANFSGYIVEETESSKLERKKALKRVAISCKCCDEKSEIKYSSFKNKKVKHICKKEKESRRKLLIVLTNMKQRCYNKNNKSFKTYGKRGITICKDWLESSSKFIEWSLMNGYKEGLEIDRINNNLGYFPENCHYTTKIKNSRNMTTNILNEEIVKTIRNTDWGDMNCRSIADKLGYKEDRVRYGKAIGGVLRNKTWKDVQ